MADHDLVIDITLGEPRVDIWCDDCLTGAAVEFDVVRLTDDGLGLLGTVRTCLRCREESGDDDD